MKRAAFDVIEPGILTTVQDLGRYGFSQFGVPPSGALDSFSLRVGNLLAGNDEGEAGLETTIMGLKLKALKEVVIAITGGNLSPSLNGEPLEMWRSHLLAEGDILAFKGIRAGCRAYLTLGGGIAVPTVMGSKSTFLSGKFGGLNGRALKKGDVLYTEDTAQPLNRIGLPFPPAWIPPLGKEAMVRVVPGPQDDHFTKPGFQTFQSSSYQVTPNSDRMGIRLDGPKIERRSDVEESIISESLVPGNIQVPGDGKPLIILNESVTGGYTKIATVISTDLPKVAQRKPGDRIRFKPVPIEEAHELLRKQEERLKAFRESLGHR
ncbi:MAG: biotin-dependent carboxyltransferase [Deltaproteobacteria bacterium]|nr:MAG: biotin-dependent carboxyltransferase [Deltaproteobacteria bacterium]